MSYASQPLDDGSQPPPVDIDTLYFEVAVGEKRRRVYGLGCIYLCFLLSKYRELTLISICNSS